MRRTARLSQPSWLASPLGVLTLLIWLLGLGLGMASVLGRLSVPSWGNPLGEAQSAELNSGSQVAQSFEAPLPGLAGVAVTIDVAASSVERRVTLRVSDASDGTLLGEQTLDVGAEASVTELRIDMAPVVNSQRRTFLFSVASDAPPSQGATLGYSPSSTLMGARAYHNGQPLVGNLQFQTYYTLSTLQKVDLILARLAEGKPRCLGSRGFLIGAGLIYVSVLSLFVWQVARAAANGEKGLP